MKHLILIICSVLICSTAQAKKFTTHGTVVSVADGDTLTILTANKVQYKIRLEHIDTPEKGQAYGKQAKQVLSDLVFNKEVEVIVSTQDRYKRHIGTIYLGELCVNLKLVEGGHAWHYKRYSKDKAYAEAETKARLTKAGLWGIEDKPPVAPWNYRSKKK